MAWDRRLDYARLRRSGARLRLRRGARGQVGDVLRVEAAGPIVDRAAEIANSQSSWGGYRGLTGGPVSRLMAAYPGRAARAERLYRALDQAAREIL